ncbi:MAG: hypothetical protein NT076_02350 [Candidatus Pacearchaeota archaeon]|nr:hypothetical protein [Candidatus Pacearchaeota archaeon]
MARAIYYLQEVCYKNKKPDKKTYLKNIMVLKICALKYAKENFPGILKKIKKHEKLLKKFGENYKIWLIKE